MGPSSHSILAVAHEPFLERSLSPQVVIFPPKTNVLSMRHSVRPEAEFLRSRFLGYTQECLGEAMVPARSTSGETFGG